MRKEGHIWSENRDSGQAMKGRLELQKGRHDELDNRSRTSIIEEVELVRIIFRASECLTHNKMRDDVDSKER